jgi:hypothetical protein
MSEIGSEKQLSSIVPSQRVLLLSQCLRPSQTCPGRFNKEGLQCPASCEQDCVVGHLKQAAAELGYKGVCIAAGGVQALRFLKERKPRGVVVVACNKELEEGVQSMAKIAHQLEETPTIIAFPLLKDGCVDTEVDEAAVLRAIRLGTDRAESSA